MSNLAYPDFVFTTFQFSKENCGKKPGNQIVLMIECHMPLIKIFKFLKVSILN